jgi:hypothetical protein
MYVSHVQGMDHTHSRMQIKIMGTKKTKNQNKSDVHPRCSTLAANKSKRRKEWA